MKKIIKIIRSRTAETYTPIIIASERWFCGLISIPVAVSSKFTKITNNFIQTQKKLINEVTHHDFGSFETELLSVDFILSELLFTK